MESVGSGVTNAPPQEEENPLTEEQLQTWNKKTSDQMNSELLMFNAKAAEFQPAYCYSRMLDFIIARMKAKMQSNKNNGRQYKEAKELDENTKKVFWHLAEICIHLTDIDSGVHPLLWIQFITRCDLFQPHSKMVLKKLPPSFLPKVTKKSSGKRKTDIGSSIALSDDGTIRPKGSERKSKASQDEVIRKETESMFAENKTEEHLVLQSANLGESSSNGYALGEQSMGEQSIEESQSNQQEPPWDSDLNLLWNLQNGTS